MINLNDAEKQREGGPIPSGSIVKVRLTIRQPKHSDPGDPAVNIYSSKLKGLDCEFCVISGTFEGSKLWENIFLPPGMQTISMTKGQESVANRGFSMCRAIIESARNLDPNDLAANRTINSWFDLNGLEFPVRVGIEKIKPGDRYINNSISKIITPNMEGYSQVMGGDEIVSETPIPEIPEEHPVNSQGASGWGADNTQPVAAQSSQTPPQQTTLPFAQPSAPGPAQSQPVVDNVPEWARV